MALRDHRSIGEIVATTPAASTLFDLLGIDYGCHGNLTLDEASAVAGLVPAHVRRSLDQLPPRGANDRNWLDEPLDAILRELREKRHPRQHELLRRVATSVAELDGDAKASLRVNALRRAFNALFSLIEPHIFREETVFFPIAHHLDDCWCRGAKPELQHVGGVSRAVADLVLDHERISTSLAAVGSYALAVAEVIPDNEELVNAIAELEHEMHEHMHLENNVLFPRLTALEVTMTGQELWSSG